MRENSVPSRRGRATGQPSIFRSDFLQINAFKKQMKLIEASGCRTPVLSQVSCPVTVQVLKRQRAHMEAARVLSFTEDLLGKHAVPVACGNLLRPAPHITLRWTSKKDEFIRILELGEKLGE
ncbi:Tex9 [Symbiodinium sp. CCMP2592]|nr:Tex9 [Symbiodinium sp. CCMP2592]